MIVHLLVTKVHPNPHGSYNTLFWLFLVCVDAKRHQIYIDNVLYVLQVFHMPF